MIKKKKRDRRTLSLYCIIPAGSRPPSPDDAVGVGVLHVLEGDGHVVLVGHVVRDGVLHHQPQQPDYG